MGGNTVGAVSSSKNSLSRTGIIEYGVGRYLRGGPVRIPHFTDKKNKVQRRKIDIKMNFNSNFKMTEACVHIFLRATMNHLNAFSCIHTLNYSEGFKKDIDGERGPRYSVECTKDY